MESIDTGSGCQWPTEDSSKWVNARSVVVYDKYSRPRTELNGEKQQTTTIYHPRRNKPVATIINADYRESGVFTCDYEENDDSITEYFDYENYWKKGDGTFELTDLITHFGEKSLQILSGIALSNVFSVEGGMSYYFNVYTKVLKDTLKLYVYHGTGVKSSWPPGTITFESPEITLIGECDWKLQTVKVNVPAGNNRFVKIAIGNTYDTTDSAYSYIDDIRFYPEDALVQSFYYDAKYGNLLNEVDENNNSVKYEYNELGLLIKKRNDEKIMTDKFEYGIGGLAEHNITILDLPEKDSLYPSVIPLKWSVTGGFFRVNIYFTLNNQRTWHLLKKGILIDQDSVYEYTCNVPYYIALESDSCFLKVASADSPMEEGFFDISKQFKIKPNKFVITFPDTSDTVEEWQMVPIEWWYSGLPITSDIEIKYSINGDTTNWYDIAITQNDSNHIWYPPNVVKYYDTLPASCVIQISGTTDSLSADVKSFSNSFTIKNARSFIRRVIHNVKNRIFLFRY